MSKKVLTKIAKRACVCVCVTYNASFSVFPSRLYLWLSQSVYMCACVLLTRSEATGRRENKRRPSLAAALLPTGCSHRVCVVSLSRTQDNWV